MAPGDEVLENYRLWLLKMATVIAPGDQGSWHDLAQEGWVAMWRALRTFDASKGALPSWLTTAARMRMTDVYRRKTWLGTPMARGHRREQPAPPVDIDDDYIMILLGTTADVFDAVEWRYHDGEIARALSELTDLEREYVVCRFWQGMTYTELKDTFKRDPRTIWNGIKPRLEAALGHLR